MFITLTLKAGAVKLNVFPVAILLLTGMIVFGPSGVLLAVAGPVSCWRVLVGATDAKGSWKATVALLLPEFET